MISRYMNSYLFISQLIRNEINFSPLILLDDPTEGYLKNYSFFDKIVFGGKNKIQSEKERDIVISETISEMSKYHVSCWNNNQIEDYALWNIYTDKLTGIIVTSTVEKILKSITDSDKMIHGIVKYKSQNKRFGNEPYTNVNARLFSKTEFYLYENEYRFAIKNETVFNENNELIKYVTIPTDFSSLVINIILSPFMSTPNKTYFKETINRLSPELSNRIIDSKIKLKNNI